MSDNEEEPVEAAGTDAPAEKVAETAPTESTETPTGGEEVGTPEFPELQPTRPQIGAPNELKRLYDVQVTVAAEIGRTTVPIQQLLGLTEGSVFELEQSVSAPIELVAQGIPLGNGEVVVVDNSFAIRIKEIYANQ